MNDVVKPIQLRYKTRAYTAGLLGSPASLTPQDPEAHHCDPTHYNDCDGYSNFPDSAGDRGAETDGVDVVDGT